MKRRTYYLKNYIRIGIKFGFLAGIQIAFSHLFGRSRIYVPQIKDKISIRPNSSDFDVFLQVFVNEEYDIPFYNEIKTIIDAGANNGYTALFFSWKFPHAKIFALEPEPDNFDMLKKNLLKVDNVIPMQAALIGGVGSKKVSLGDGEGWTRRITEEEGTVQGYSLEYLIAQFKLERIGLLKIDIEGGEISIFQNSIVTWVDKVKNIVIELHDRFQPGCTKVFFEAFRGCEYQAEFRGENVILRDIKCLNS